MPFSINDVHVIPLSSSGALIRIQSSPAVSAEDSSEEDRSTPKAYTSHGDKHHDDGVPFTVVPITAIVFTFIWLIVKAIMAPFNQRNRQARYAASTSGGGLTEEEVAILQKLQRTLSQMESRVEALETILIDQNRTAKNYGSKF